MWPRQVAFQRQSTSRTIFFPPIFGKYVRLSLGRCLWHRQPLPTVSKIVGNTYFLMKGEEIKTWGPLLVSPINYLYHDLFHAPLGICPRITKCLHRNVESQISIERGVYSLLPKKSISCFELEKKLSLSFLFFYPFVYFGAAKSYISRVNKCFENLFTCK